MKRGLLVSGLPALLLFALALVVRLNQHHTALLYPDGYQYLLMARGISEHLEPTTVLGPGGESFAPSPDAAAKPLYPVLVAVVHTLGFTWLDAAGLVTAAAGALAVVFLALVVAKLSGSQLAGLGAGLLVLASPSVAFWSGFSGPDPLAQALLLGAALAFVYRLSRTGGVLTGLAVAARPEIALVAVAAAIVSLRSDGARRDLARAAPAAVITASLTFLLIRTPITIQDRRLLWLAPLLLAGLALLVLVPSSLLRLAPIAALGAIAFVFMTESGPFELWHDDWPLLVLGAVGVVLLARDERRSLLVAIVLGGVVLLGAVYLVKNPTLSRYFSLLLPAAAVLAGVAVASLPHRARPVAHAVIALAVVVGFLRPVPGSRDYDMFSAVATSVAPRLESAPLVTAAPDAYGFWLPDHSVVSMRRGARGAVLLDAAQRLYEPRLSARGTVLARVSGEIAFARPNGDLDADPAVLVAGRVVEADARSRGRRTLSTSP